MKTTTLVILTASFSALACRSAAPLPEDPLPFHVALAPAETLDSNLPIIEAREASYATQEEPEAQQPTGKLQLRLDSERVTQGLAEALRRGFARVTVLAPPEDENFAQASESDRAKYWQEQALTAGADLWVQPSVQYEPKIERETNEKFWLNLPLFLLGGPFCYFVGDNTYNARVKLNADFIDISSPRDDPLDNTVLRIPIQVEFEGTDLTFIDRADDAGDYLLSIIVPAGFLSRSSDDVVDEVREEIIDEISAAFVREVHENDRFFSKSDRIADVELAHELAVVERAGQEIAVSLPVTASSYVLEVGDVQIRAEVPQEREADGYQWIRQHMAVGADQQYLRVRLLDARSEPRAYTLRIPVDEELVTDEPEAAPPATSASAGAGSSSRAATTALAGTRP